MNRETMGSNRHHSLAYWGDGSFSTILNQYQTLLILIKPMGSHHHCLMVESPCHEKYVSQPTILVIQSIKPPTGCLSMSIGDFPLLLTIIVGYIAIITSWVHITMVHRGPPWWAPTQPIPRRLEHHAPSRCLARQARRSWEMPVPDLRVTLDVFKPPKKGPIPTYLKLYPETTHLVLLALDIYNIYIYYMYNRNLHVFTSIQCILVSMCM